MGKGDDPAPPGNPAENDGENTSPGNPGNRHDHDCTRIKADTEKRVDDAKKDYEKRKRQTLQEESARCNREWQGIARRYRGKGLTARRKDWLASRNAALQEVTRRCDRERDEAVARIRAESPCR